MEEQTQDVRNEEAEIVTAFARTADWWRKVEGAVVEETFVADGMQYWRITTDIATEMAQKMQPAYLNDVIAAETREYPAILLKRFAPNLFTVTVKGHVALTTVANERFIVVSRRKDWLRTLFHSPENNQVPTYKELKRDKQIMNLFQKLQGEGAVRVMYAVSEDTVETFDLKTVSAVLRMKWNSSTTKSANAMPAASVKGANKLSLVKGE